MGKEANWPEGFVDALEEAISRCASQYNISQEQKIALETALERPLGRELLLRYASRI
jgi:hypothetical protein